MGQLKTVLSVQHLTKEIKGKLIVQDISFDVVEGEIVGLLGANGAGKTTTMKMIVGLSTISAGDVQIAGYSIKSQFSKALFNVGAVIEAPAFYPYLSGYENLRQYQRLHKNASKDWLLEVASLTGIEHALEQRVSTYSMGMKQRLGIAQALLRKPKLLVLDEPMNALDPAGVRETRNYLNRIAADLGVAIVISSHQLSEIEQMARRVVIMQNGCLVTEERIDDGLNDGKFYITLHVDNVELTSEVVVNLFGDDHHALDYTQTKKLSNGLHTMTVAIDEGQVPKLIRALCDARVEVHRVLPAHTSLEDKFLKWTTARGEVN
ncbi:ABC transporter ATP-binding protein [Bacillus toyonensis]|nr:Bacitracin transport ATP-binding protein bcrA [Bacillus cereus Rock1-3]PDZ30880.1 ABC transporter ATP-binding protein [Bacillus toyonensis]PEI46933.1 ABC transporter ATP-binding protein [Bacillus toyonensis]PEJ10970.1 ABC transporter ATP-binding protein [Bacillus toyonensis]PEJ84755.1 ABC transporter ATP-binding protein [Bacillus toyonensis]